MGFDIFGLSAASKKGEYFRNNVWWWRPLAAYIVEHCGVDPNGWFENSGHKVSAVTARKIAAKLDELVFSGQVKEYEREYRAQLASLPDEECSHCHGSGVRSDEFVQGTCNGCLGKGHVEAFAKWYPFSEANVRAFADFCRDSGGFAIC